jgi:4-hydroxybenzoate polyprenyltransferase
MIKFSHSIFALPFALSGAVLAGFEAELTFYKLFFIVLAMVSARSAAMGFNRLVDIKIDGKNPRTENRSLPSGKMSQTEVKIFVLFFSFLFATAAYGLNSICFYLSPAALFIIFFYSYTKRFTSFSHYVLGLGLGISPIGAWLAITGSFAALPLILGAAVLFWAAGFDIIYSCQDYEFDKAHKLRSIPALLGLKQALFIAKMSHLIAFILLLVIEHLAELHFIYSAGLLVIAAVLTYEHRLVHQNNLKQVGYAFLNMNGIVSIVFFLSVAGDLILL